MPPRSGRLFVSEGAAKTEGFDKRKDAAMMQRIKSQAA
jgi:hypothetical protein